MANKGSEVRIVGGVWRSRRIRFGARPGLRPTPDRVRETLFNWLGQDLTGLVCLDLFAGSGALGFEAASRGAKRVVMVEHDAVAFSALVSNREALDARQVEAVKADALEFLRDSNSQSDRSEYDVIFLDPPFQGNDWLRLLPLLPNHLAPRGRVYYESATQALWPEDWQVIRERRAGQVFYQLVTRTAS